MSTNPQWKSFQPPDTMNQDSAIIDFKPMTSNGNIFFLSSTPNYDRIIFQAKHRKHLILQIAPHQIHGSGKTFLYCRTSRRHSATVCTDHRVQHIPILVSPLARSHLIRTTCSTAAETAHLPTTYFRTVTTAATTIPIRRIWAPERQASSKSCW
jgi:hypothetical protein